MGGNKCFGSQRDFPQPQKKTPDKRWEGVGGATERVEAEQLDGWMGWLLARWWFQIICFMFTPKIGEGSEIWLIFQMGWNHQLVD